jgi:hypothetical protein
VKFLVHRFVILCAVATLASGLIAAAAFAQSDDRKAKPGSDHAAANTGDQPLTTLSVQVKVINVLAAVRDKHGNIVNNLTKDDFILTQDGRPQVIKYFSKETDLPLALGMLVDTSMSQRRVLTEERDASETFLAQVLREDEDKAFVIHFDREVELLQDLTASHEKLRAALESLETPRFTRASQGGGDPDPNSDAVEVEAPVVAVAVLFSTTRSSWLPMN